MQIALAAYLATHCLLVGTGLPSCLAPGSHMIFTVRLQTEGQQQKAVEHATLCGSAAASGGSKKTSTRKLTFCDLGGCERQSYTCCPRMKLAC